MYRFWLHHLPGVGDKTIEKLLGRFGDAREVYAAGQAALEEVLGNNKALKVTEFRKRFQLQRAYEEMRDKKIAFYTKEDEEYPVRLREIPHPPYGLYCLRTVFRPLPSSGRGNVRSMEAPWRRPLRGDLEKPVFPLSAAWQGG